MGGVSVVLRWAAQEASAERTSPPTFKTSRRQLLCLRFVLDKFCPPYVAAENIGQVVDNIQYVVCCGEVCVVQKIFFCVVLYGMVFGPLTRASRDPHTGTEGVGGGTLSFVTQVTKFVTPVMSFNLTLVSRFEYTRYQERKRGLI